MAKWEYMVMGTPTPLNILSHGKQKEKDLLTIIFPLPGNQTNHAHY